MQAGSFYAEVSIRGGHARFIVAQTASEAIGAVVLVSGTSGSVGDAMREAEAMLDGRSH